MPPFFPHDEPPGNVFVQYGAIKRKNRDREKAIEEVIKAAPAKEGRNADFLRYRITRDEHGAGFKVWGWRNTEQDLLRSLPLEVEGFRRGDVV